MQQEPVPMIDALHSPDPDRATTAPARAARLPAALAVSCAIHAAIIVVPSLGGGSLQAQPASAKRTQALTASLAGATANFKAALPAEPPAPAAEPPVDAAEDSPASGLGMLPVPALAYFTPDELTKRPQPLELGQFDTPEMKTIAAAGKLVVKLWIDDEGRVADAVIEESDLPELFAQTAVAAFRNTRFAPGERDGLPVGTVTRVEMIFDGSRAPGR